MNETERNKVFDVLKFFAIFLVLWGHSSQHFLSGNYWEKPLYRIIYSFHMPLFMIIVGFFATKLINLNFIAVAKKKFCQLLLPSIIWGVFFLLFGSLRGGIASGISSFYHAFWFLKSAFVCTAIYYITFYFSNEKLRGLLIFFSLIISQFIDGFNINIMYPCFLFGVIINRHFNWIKDNAGILIVTTGFIFLIMLLFWDESFWTGKTGIQLQDFQGNYQKIFSNLYLNIYRITIGLVGSLFFILLFEYSGRFIKTSKVGNVICKWGQYTLGIYILQTFIIEVFLRKFLCFDNTNFVVFNFLIAPGISLLTLIVCVYCIKIIQHSKIMSLLLLGKKF